VEEYLNLYHQKLWEIAYDNLIRVFSHPHTIILFVLFLIICSLICFLFFGKTRTLLFVVSYFFLFLLGGVAEYVNSYSKIMNPSSPYNNSLSIASLRHETVLPMLEHVDEIPLASVDGELKREDIILFAVSNPTYYDGLFNDIAMLLTGEYKIGTDFLVAFPGDEEKDLQKFSKVLHIKKDEAEGATGIISKLQKFYEKKLESEKIDSGLMSMNFAHFKMKLPAWGAVFICLKNRKVNITYSL